MSKKIGTIRDKNNELLVIFASNSLTDVPAMPLFLKTYAEIIEKGWASSSFQVTNTSKMVWVERTNGKVAGGICFDYKEAMKMSWIVLSFTDPSERGKGINSICHYECEKISKSLGATHLCSLVHIENKNRLRAAEKVGFNPQFYRMHKEL